MPDDQTEIVKGHCPKCDAVRKAHVRAKHKHREDADEEGRVYGVLTDMVLECCGCEVVYFRRDFWFSENVEDTFEPNGVHSNAPEVETTYWPVATKRKPPEWMSRVQARDAILGNLIVELYSALNTGLAVLAAIGARTVFDRATDLLGVDPASTFEEKLRSLVQLGRIGEDEFEILTTLTEVGNAAAHRGWKPSPEEVSTIMDVVETFLHRSMVLGDAMSKITVPQKPKRKRK
jgi:Domain of unknown function (DUF4145)